MGEVWRATDTALGRQVAVKLLRPRYAVHEEDLVRFRAEARHAASLSHPGIARVYDYGGPEAAHPPYLVMELVDGPSVARLLDEGPLTPAYTMGLVAQAAAALQAAHAAGLVHRDIKPGNLLVSRIGQLKVTDFGVSQAAGSVHLTRPGALLGTPAYMAPERTAGAPATPAADLYALGIVAFQCLTGRRPYTGEPLAVALAHLEQPMPPLPASVPAEVAALVADLTAKDPLARPASAAEVAERAESLRKALTGTAPPPRRAHSRRFTRHPLRTAGVAITIPAVAMACWALAGAVAPTSPHPSSSPFVATRQPGHHRSHHPAPPVVPVAGTRVPRTTGAPGRGDQFAAANTSPTPSGAAGTPPAPAAPPAPKPRPASTGTPTPRGTPTPTGTPSPTGTPTTSGSPTATGTPTPTGTPAPSGEPTPTGTSPSGTPAPSGTGTSTGTPTSPGTSTPGGTTDPSGSGDPGGPTDPSGPPSSGTTATSGPSATDGQPAPSGSGVTASAGNGLARSG